MQGFLGATSDTALFMLEPGGSTDAYADLVTEMCAFTFQSGNSQCGDREVQAAKDGGGQYYLSGTHGDQNCVCSEESYVAAPVFLSPGSHDDATGVAERAVHEYTHAFQKAMAGPVPAWSMEGGAVFMECLMAERVRAGMGYRECMKHSGGGGGSSGTRLPSTSATNGECCTTTWAPRCATRC